MEQRFNDIATRLLGYVDSPIPGDVSSVAGDLLEMIRLHPVSSSLDGFWQVREACNRILAEIYPMHSRYLLLATASGHGHGPRVDLDRNDLIALLLIELLNGIRAFDSSEARKETSGALLSCVPNPIPRPTFPFVDGE